MKVSRVNGPIDLELQDNVRVMLKCPFCGDTAVTDFPSDGIIGFMKFCNDNALPMQPLPCVCPECKGKEPLNFITEVGGVIPIVFPEDETPETQN